ncbi:BadF/BadG/BcrA/BcrD ATPase family protein [Paraburkholderia sp. BCC1886]|uniref:BadF/BadG/BcrA/BcrD ATPase family protein n=1 Tax=Paraburkholderia sp. BCC1886 TaxID=2562670 RepID=UPI001182AC4A|nr:BadF/BadG/BcrA/BcrD ATPase family protein [Paraburkholderia sp. BCC1886]
MNRERLESGAPVRCIGVDGGGTGTRVVLGDGMQVIAEAQGGPAALSRGVEAAWRTIEAACVAAFVRIGEPFAWDSVTVGIGIAGAHNEQWRREFIACAPVTLGIVVETDSYTSLLGAHGGEPGICIATGTGSVGEALYADGSTRVVGGFGFPAGDEASGAWFGLHAVGHMQKVVDGRSGFDALARDLFALVGIDGSQPCPAELAQRYRSTLMRWLASAAASDYARLAPTVFTHDRHLLSRELIGTAIDDVLSMVDTLDPTHELPVALSGGLASCLAAYLGDRLGGRLVSARASSAHGALSLAYRTRGAELKQRQTWNAMHGRSKPAR